MIKIPWQLQNPTLRLYPIRSDSKMPVQKSWNTTQNYQASHPLILDHLCRGGNYGVVCGIGSLIVLDFDSQDYFDSVKHSLPLTFTVLTAGRRLPHCYYFLQGEMIGKKGIDIDGKRVLDIQGSKTGVVGPGSMIGERRYEVWHDVPITLIDFKFLNDTFKEPLETASEREARVNRNPSTMQNNPEEVKRAVELLKRAGIRQMYGGLFQCFRHEMKGNGNLAVMPNGRLYCFHCQKCWSTAQAYVDSYFIQKSKKW